MESAIDSDAQTAYLVEYDFIREGMRQDQRERHAFLAFTLAAAGLVLGLLMRSEPSHSATQACYLVCLVALVTLIAERLTWRSSLGAASAGMYIRLFLEPKVGALRFQERDVRFRQILRGTGSAHGFSVAYASLTAAFVLGWFAAPVEDGRTWWQTAIVGGFAAWSGLHIYRLRRLAVDGYEPAAKAWRQVEEEEREKAEHNAPRETPE